MKMIEQTSNPSVGTITPAVITGDEAKEAPPTGISNL
jgi:hypothetical protein